MIVRRLILKKFKSVRKSTIFPKIFLLTILSLINVYSCELEAKELKNKIPVPTSIETNFYDQNTDYILGPGDVIKIDFEGLDIFDGNYTINPEGYLLLPEVEYVYANYKTLKELKSLLLLLYQDYLIDPSFLIAIESYRELNVTLRGEVTQTGLYKLDYSLKNTIINNSPEEQRQTPVYISPKLFDLLQKGEGITTNADLKNIVVIRNNPIISGGGKIQTKLNLISLLENGDQSQNITLRDGDDIFIGRTDKPIIEQLNSINKSNLTPSEINVFINGNVANQGSLTIKQGSSLYEAIAAAGEKSLSGRIELLRLKNSGNNEKRFISYNKNNLKGTYGNPILVNGDIIIVRQNLLGKTTQAIKEYSSPVINSYAIYKIFN